MRFSLLIFVSNAIYIILRSIILGLVDHRTEIWNFINSCRWKDKMTQCLNLNEELLSLINNIWDFPLPEKYIANDFSAVQEALGYLYKEDLPVMSNGDIHLCLDAKNPILRHSDLHNIKEQIMAIIDENSKENRADIIVIAGHTGAGKTTVSFMVSEERWCHYDEASDFSRRHPVYGTGMLEFTEHIKNINQQKEEMLSKDIGMCITFTCHFLFMRDRFCINHNCTILLNVDAPTDTYIFSKTLLLFVLLIKGIVTCPKDWLWIGMGKIPIYTIYNMVYTLKNYIYHMYTYGINPVYTGYIP